MPGFDRTGPSGQGPMTGRGFGPCGGGMGRGRGCGYGNGYGYRRFLTQTEEKDVLKQEAEMLEQELKAIKERLGQAK